MLILGTPNIVIDFYAKNNEGPPKIYPIVFSANQTMINRNIYSSQYSSCKYIFIKSLVTENVEYNDCFIGKYEFVGIPQQTPIIDYSENDIFGFTEKMSIWSIDGKYFVYKDLNDVVPILCFSETCEDGHALGPGEDISSYIPTGIQSKEIIIYAESGRTVDLTKISSIVNASVIGRSAKSEITLITNPSMINLSLTDVKTSLTDVDTNILELKSSSLSSVSFKSSENTDLIATHDSIDSNLIKKGQKFKSIHLQNINITSITYSTDEIIIITEGKTYTFDNCNMTIDLANTEILFTLNEGVDIKSSLTLNLRNELSISVEGNGNWAMDPFVMINNGENVVKIDSSVAYTVPFRYESIRYIKENLAKPKSAKYCFVENDADCADGTNKGITGSSFSFADSDIQDDVPALEIIVGPHQSKISVDMKALTKIKTIIFESLTESRVDLTAILPYNIIDLNVEIYNVNLDSTSVSMYYENINILKMKNSNFLALTNKLKRAYLEFDDLDVFYSDSGIIVAEFCDIVCDFETITLYERTKPYNDYPNKFKISDTTKSFYVCSPIINITCPNSEKIKIETGKFTIYSEIVIKSLRKDDSFTVEVTGNGFPSQNYLDLQYPGFMIYPSVYCVFIFDSYVVGNSNVAVGINSQYPVFFNLSGYIRININLPIILGSKNNTIRVKYAIKDEATLILAGMTFLQNESFIYVYGSCLIYTSSHMIYDNGEVLPIVFCIENDEFSRIELPGDDPPYHFTQVNMLVSERIKNYLPSSTELIHVVGVSDISNIKLHYLYADGFHLTHGYQDENSCLVPSLSENKKTFILTYKNYFTIPFYFCYASSEEDQSCDPRAFIVQQTPDYSAYNVESCYSGIFELHRDVYDLIIPFKNQRSPENLTIVGKNHEKFAFVGNYSSMNMNIQWQIFECITFDTNPETKLSLERRIVLKDVRFSDRCNIIMDYGIIHADWDHIATVSPVQYGQYMSFYAYNIPYDATIKFNVDTIQINDLYLYKTEIKANNNKYNMSLTYEDSEIDANLTFILDTNGMNNEIPRLVNLNRETHIYFQGADWGLFNDTSRLEISNNDIRVIVHEINFIPNIFSDPSSVILSSDLEPKPDITPSTEYIGPAITATNTGDVKTHIPTIVVLPTATEVVYEEKVYQPTGNEAIVELEEEEIEGNLIIKAETTDGERIPLNIKKLKISEEGKVLASGLTINDELILNYGATLQANMDDKIELAEDDQVSITMILPSTHLDLGNIGANYQKSPRSLKLQYDTEMSEEKLREEFKDGKILVTGKTLNCETWKAKANLISNLDTSILELICVKGENSKKLKSNMLMDLEADSLVIKAKEISNEGGGNHNPTSSKKDMNLIIYIVVAVVVVIIIVAVITIVCVKRSKRSSSKSLESSSSI